MKNSEPGDINCFSSAQKRFGIQSLKIELTVADLSAQMPIKLFHGLNTCEIHDGWQQLKQFAGTGAIEGAYQLP
jgi:hypothetical protein